METLYVEGSGAPILREYFAAQTSMELGIVGLGGSSIDGGGGGALGSKVVVDWSVLLAVGNGWDLSTVDSAHEMGREETLAPSGAWVACDVVTLGSGVVLGVVTSIRLLPMRDAMSIAPSRSNKPFCEFHSM